MNESKERGLSLHVCAALVLATVLQVRSLLISLPQDVAAEAAAAQAGGTSGQIEPGHPTSRLAGRDRDELPASHQDTRMTSALLSPGDSTTVAFRAR